MQLRLLQLPVCRWVHPAICQQYGIADCAANAWNEAGAGKFSFKIDKSGEILWLAIEKSLVWYDVVPPERSQRHDNCRLQ